MKKIFSLLTFISMSIVAIAQDNAVYTLALDYEYQHTVGCTHCATRASSRAYVGLTSSNGGTIDNPYVTSSSSLSLTYYELRSLNTNDGFSYTDYCSTFAPTYQDGFSGQFVNYCFQRRSESIRNFTLTYGNTVEYGNANSTNLESYGFGIKSYAKSWLLPYVPDNNISTNYCEPIFAREGIAVEDGYWEYLVQGDPTWKPITNTTYRNLYPLNISLEQLDAVLPEDLAAMGNIQLRFRLTASGSGTSTRFFAGTVDSGVNNNPINQTTTISFYTVEYSSCGIELDQTIDNNPEVISDVSCHNGNDGQIRLTFERELASEESLQINLYRDSSSEPEILDTLTRTDFNGTRTYTYSGNLLTAGEYRITWQLGNISGGDLNSANSEAFFTIEQPSEIIINDLTIVQPSCTNSNGQVTIDASGGGFPSNPNIPLQYRIKDTGDTWQDSPTFNLPPNNNYIFEASSLANNSCISEPSEQIEFLPFVNPLGINITGTLEPTLVSSSDGEISVTTANAVGNINYQIFRQPDLTNPIRSINNGNLVTTFSGLEAGNYSIVVTDSEGCSMSAAASLQAIPIPNLSLTEIQEISCFNTDDGTVDFTITNGVAPYSFTWITPNQTITGTLTNNNFNRSNLTPGKYELRVSSNQARPGAFATSGEIVIVNPDEIVISANPIDALCNGSKEAFIQLNFVSGNATEYRFGSSTDWTEIPTINLIPIEPNRIYSITARNENGCESNTIININASEPDSVTFLTTPVTKNVTTTGGTDGSIQIEVEGGTPGYTYEWTRSDTPNSARIAFTPPIGSTGDNLINIPAGYYQVTVRDSNDCTTALEPIIEIIEPGLLRMQSFTGSPITCNGQNDGTLTVNIQGTLPTTYIWILEDGSPTGLEIARETNTLNTATINGLGPGIYHVLVQDADVGPIQSDNSLTIIDPDLITSIVTFTPSCFGADTGSIIISNSIGGTLAPTSNYKYSNDSGLSFQNSNTFVDLSAGTYNVVVQDDNNCFYLETVTIVETEEITLNTANTIAGNVTAQGNGDGFIFAVFDGGFGQLSYQWAGPNVGGITSQNIGNLVPGTYTVTVTDQNLCSVIETFTITEPGPLSITLNQQNNISCFGANDGSILSTVVGEAPIVYTWSEINSGVLTTTAEDDIENLPPGTYTLTVTDASTTPAVTSAEIIITEPDALTGEVFPTNVSCADETDGSIIVNVIGGTPNFEYSLDNGANYQPNANISGLAAGNYTVRVRDINGCTLDLPFTINAPLSLGAEIVSQSLSQAGAADGAISLVAFGGTGNLTYAWTGPNGFTSSEENNLTGLIGGTYQLTLTDDNDCVFVSDTIEIAEPGELLVSINQTVFLECNSDTFGEITATVQGGILPYTFQWFDNSTGNENVLSEDTSILGNLSAGSYFLRITDGNGISRDSNEITITEPDLLEIEFLSLTPVLCSGESTGAIDISVSGGTLPYTFSWDNGALTEDLNDVPTGTYNILVSDGNGCFTELDVTIDAAPDAIQIADATVNNLSDYQSNDGSIAIDITGGATPYIISWIRNSDNENFGSQPTINNLSADSYTITIVDDNGCGITETYEITQPDIVEETLNPPTCTGESNGSISLQVNKGNGNFTYVWNTGETTNVINNLSAGSYTVTILGFDDGPLTRTYVLENPLPIAVDLGPDRTLCLNQVLNLDATVADATATYSWISDNGFSSISPIVTLTATGNYSVTVQTESGCTAVGTIFVDISTAEIDAEFAMSSQVFVGETLIAVDISYPLPESLEWVLPENTTIVKQDSDEAQIIFNEPGEYEITVHTSRGGCTATKSKKVMVLAMDPTINQESALQGEGKSVKDFVVYPNPSNGLFTVDVTLPNRGNISVKVFNFANNAMMAVERANGKSAYNIPFDISGMPTGVYAIVLETPNGNWLQKLVLR